MNTTARSSEGHLSHGLSYALLAAGCILLAIAFLAGIADNPPGIVCLLGGSLAVLLGFVFLFQRHQTRRPGQQLLYWAPRGLCIVMALFLSMFALDVFGAGHGFWSTTLALLLHLLPTFAILLVLAISWRREWIGAVLFVALALLYAAWSWHKPFGRSAIPLISGPLLLVGVLFLLNWLRRRQLRGAA